MKSNTFEAIVGAVVIFLAVVFLFVGFSSMKFKKGDNYNLSAAFFNRIDGIKIGSDIRMSGIKIGTVARARVR